MVVTKIYSFSGSAKNGEIKQFVSESNFKLNEGYWQISIDSCHIEIKQKVPKAIIVGICTNLISQVRNEEVTVYDSKNKARKKQQLVLKHSIIGTFIIPNLGVCLCAKYKMCNGIRRKSTRHRMSKINVHRISTRHRMSKIRYNTPAPSTKPDTHPLLSASYVIN